MLLAIDIKASPAGAEAAPVAKVPPFKKKAAAAIPPTAEKAPATPTATVAAGDSNGAVGLVVAVGVAEASIVVEALSVSTAILVVEVAEIVVVPNIGASAVYSTVVLADSTR